MKTSPKRNGTIRFLFENSMFLIGGAVVALLWANVSPESYKHFIHFSPFSTADNESAFSIHFLVNDFLMALFFGIAAKEVWEAFLPGGDLHGLKKAATPLIATLGGVVMPALLFLGGAWVLGSLDELGRGWAVPCATDIAFSYIFARLVFGKSHPAIPFLLLLAIADDGIGLIIIAIAYPQHAVHPEWLLLAGAAMVLARLFHRRLRLHSFWWYLLIPGAMSWIGFYQAGLHAALSLVPIIPFMPHAKTDLGLFAKQEWGRHDTLNEFEHWWKNPVELILGTFGLCNAGVVLASFSSGSVLVLGGLLIGKPLGITSFALSGRLVGLKLPNGIGVRELVSLGTVAGIGFTVALFVADAAFPPGATLDSMKMGALASIFVGGVAFVLARALGVRPVPIAAPPVHVPAVMEEVPVPEPANV